MGYLIAFGAGVAVGVFLKDKIVELAVKAYEYVLGRF